MQSSRLGRQCWLRHLARPVASSDAPPAFLCPATSSFRPSRPTATHQPPWCQQHSLHTDTIFHAAQDSSRLAQPPPKSLPLQCPGCGAFAQTTEPAKPGFFDLERNATRKRLGLFTEAPRNRPEDRVVREALNRIDSPLLQQLQLSELLSNRPDPHPAADSDGPPLCHRCHNLLHHSHGTPVYHPSIDSIRETLQESSHKYNHIYHVLDAADFPMSLVPRIHDLLEAMPLRSRNRRSREAKFYYGRLTELSFIVTRSDLLAPSKPQVDRLMPWITAVLRDALGRVGQRVRLGGIHCVSAKRGWWMKELKEEVWKRGGATWMVGKANVGKSYLFQHVFPKGRMDWGTARPVTGASSAAPAAAPVDPAGPGAANLDPFAMLPPPQPETNYPTMPLVSPLPGTTASPIRLAFGNGKGELIDLPGLPRSRLIDHVEPSHRDLLVMKSRVQPEQAVLKGQRHSLLLGGFIRLTPQTPDVIFLAYNFTPLTEHLTQTEKAVSIQGQTGEVKVDNVSLPGTGQRIKLAGSFELKYDVTKERTGPITRRDAVGIKLDRLPYRVMAVDILVEGCGWVEVVAQVRTKGLYKPRRRDSEGGASSELLQTLDLSEAGQGEPNWPVIDVYSPGGEFIAARRPLNAWLLCQPRKSASRRARPRKSMKGAKKRAKATAREAGTGDKTRALLEGH